MTVSFAIDKPSAFFRKVDVLPPAERSPIAERNLDNVPAAWAIFERLLKTG